MSITNRSVRFWAKMIPPVTNELKLVKKFLLNPTETCEELTHFMFDREEPFNNIGRCNFISQLGIITVYADKYGYEVIIGSVRHLLDCEPWEYRLSYDQCDMLFKAIISNIPGSASHKEKLERKERLNHDIDNCKKNELDSATRREYFVFGELPEIRKQNCDRHFNLSGYVDLRGKEVHTRLD